VGWSGILYPVAKPFNVDVGFTCDAAGGGGGGGSSAAGSGGVCGRRTLAAGEKTTSVGDPTSRGRDLDRDRDLRCGRILGTWRYWEVIAEDMVRSCMETSGGQVSNCERVEG